MRKIITVLALTVLVTLNVMARPVTRVIKDEGSYGVILAVDTDSYGKDFKFSDINMGELKVHYNYFVFENYYILDVDKKPYKIGQAKGMDMWVTKFSDLFKYADELINEGYAYVSLTFVTDGFNADDMIKGQLYVTNSGYVFGYWDYHY